MNRPLFSVVVCTHNRSNLLAAVLETLCHQTVPTAAYEVIVVDNNSTDATQQVVAQFREKCDNVRYVLETAVGLSHARNRGWQEARGDYVAYTDDDCLIPAYWLALAELITQSAGPALFGGPYYAFYNSPKPRWYKDSYGSRQLDSIPRKLADGEYLSGGNMFVCRSLFTQIGGFPGQLGMAGERVAYGEEVEFQRRIRVNSPNELLYYDPRLYVFHLVRTEKMNLQWIIASSFAKGRDVYLSSLIRNGKLSCTRGVHKDIMYTGLAMFFDLAVRSWQRDRQKYPHIYNYLYEHSGQYLRRIGRLSAQLERRNT